MTTVKFVLDSSGDVKRLMVSGHSGYADEGSDIVCAAVSASVQMLEMQIAQVIGEEKASFEVVGEADITYKLPEDLSEKEAETVQFMLKGFFGYMQAVSKHYEDFLTLKTEVKTC